MKKKYESLLLLILSLLLTSCLDMFQHHEYQIVGVIYYVNAEGGNHPFIGRKVSRGNYELLVPGNLIRAEGNNRILLIKMEGADNPSGGNYVINMIGERVSVNRISENEYHGMLKSLSVNVQFIPTIEH
ncbi:hypothetical protein [Chitinophaga rhizophila]|uniref:Lipoprotein n=1 Tax=Chitinophaga rhizophila TaxID=2866212 RepID=A0ABS7GH20_9BACT|nr:hypothetical protein [Chitinophaga rhizophila]MBW8686973.1 hypothetical protein [Chitinophaga rhizophila]